MAKIDLHRQALEDCQSSANRLSKEFADLAGQYPAKSADSKIFGDLTGSASLAAVLDKIETGVSGELGQAQHKLQGVERALEKVVDNVRAANKSSGSDQG